MNIPFYQEACTLKNDLKSKTLILLGHWSTGTSADLPITLLQAVDRVTSCAFTGAVSLVVCDIAHIQTTPLLTMGNSGTRSMPEPQGKLL